MRILIVLPRQTKMQAYHLAQGYGYISSSLKQAGHEVRMLNPNHSLEALGPLWERNIREFEPEVLAIGGMAFHLVQARQLAAMARPLLPHALFLAGGPMVTYEPEIAMKAMPEVDIGVLGEGERTVVDLLEALATGRDLDTVAGIVRRGEGGTTLQTPPRLVEENLDALPWADWEGLGLDVYASLAKPGEIAPGLIIENNARVMPFLTSRGCPHRCTFCCHDMAGRRFRSRSLDNVFAELEYTIDRFGINTIFIYDDVFCLKKERLHAFCHRIRPLKLRWECSLRVEQVTQENLSLMRDSGCVCVGFGVESMSQTVLKSMIKQTTVERLDRALKLMYDVKMTTWANLIFGDPAETLETATESLEWWAAHNHYDLRTDMIGFHPGSKIYNDAVAHGLITDSLDYLLKGQWELNATTMSDEEFREMKKKVGFYKTVFPFPCRILELSMNQHNLFSMKSLCPHCGVENIHTDFSIKPDILNRQSCSRCNQLFRLPVRLRPATTPPELKEAIQEAESWLASHSSFSIKEGEEIWSICQRILSLDQHQDKYRDILIQLAESFSPLSHQEMILKNCILKNPLNPVYHQKMHDLLNKMNRGQEAVKHARQANLLNTLGIRGPVDIHYTTLTREA